MSIIFHYVKLRSLSKFPPLLFPLFSKNKTIKRRMVFGKPKRSVRSNLNHSNPFLKPSSSRTNKFFTANTFISFVF